MKKNLFFLCLCRSIKFFFSKLISKVHSKRVHKGEHSFAASWCRPFKSLSLSLSVLFVFVFFFVKDLRNGVAR